MVGGLWDHGGTTLRLRVPSRSDGFVAIKGLSPDRATDAPGIDARMDVKDIYGAGELVGGQDRDEPLEVRAGAFSVTRPRSLPVGESVAGGSGSAGHLLHNPRSGVSRFLWARRPTRRPVSGGARELAVDLSGDVAAQHAADLAHGLALSGASRHVVAGALVVAHAGQHDRVGNPATGR